MSDANALGPGVQPAPTDPAYEAGWRDAFRVAITQLRMTANPEEFPKPPMTEPQGSPETEKERVHRHRMQVCLDACRGIPTEALEKGALGAALGWLDSFTYAPQPDSELQAEAARRLLRALGRLP